MSSTEIINPSNPTLVEAPLKRRLGQFFTTTNPFVNEAFVRWLKNIPAWDEMVFLEPFAGANNIVGMIQDLGYSNNWACFDIEPVNDADINASGVPVAELNTLLDYPKHFEIAITNPPYLAKNSATFRGLEYAGGEFDDVYKKALDVMLKNTPYVAAIIPDSFITQNLFHDRLHAVVSLACRMFDDTEVPVCLALFVPSKSEEMRQDFEIWSDNRWVGSYAKLQRHLACTAPDQRWKFNDPLGQIGLHAADNQQTASIRFVDGGEIPSNRILKTSRHITRISLEGLSPTALPKLIATANALLAVRRDKTQDVFMTAFKGLRADGRYRRRLDWAQTRSVLNEAFEQVAGASA